MKYKLKAEVVRRLIKKRKLTRIEIAREYGIKYQKLQRAMAGGYDQLMTEEEVQKLANVLKTTLETIVEQK